MPVPKHFRFSFRGIFTNTPEQWNFGFNMSTLLTDIPDPGVDDITTEDVTSAFQTFIAGPSDAAISERVKAMDWRAYLIGTDGRMEGNPLFVDVSTESIQGSAANRYPPQVALAVTLVGANRGPARFGRFFIPGPAEALGTDMRLSVASATGYAEAATNFMKDVSDTLDFSLANSSSGLNISSRGSGGEGTKQEIDHIEVGRVLDTLRTRRNALLEDRHVHGHIDW
jgi:hypothetical protein